MMQGKHIRFEMTFDGEAQEVGFLMGLYEMEMDEDEIEELMTPFNKSLATPPYHKWQSTDDYYHAAYFTSQGYSRFKEDIERIIEAVRYKNNGWKVEIIHSYFFPEEYLIYEDEDQAIIRTYYVDSLEHIA